MTLNRAMVLEALRRVPDGAGGYAEAWDALGTLWAEVKAGTGREVSGVETAGPAVSYRITVRAAAPGSPSRPTAGQRLREGERVFRILAVADADARHLTCFAQEGIR